jgi:predicted MFS family arabinose efflux permease
MFTAFTEFFAKTYGFSAGVAGLAYLGLGVGFFAATLFGAKFAGQICGYVCACCYLPLSALVYYWNSLRQRMAAVSISNLEDVLILRWRTYWHSVPRSYIEEHCGNQDRSRRNHLVVEGETI